MNVILLESYRSERHVAVALDRLNNMAMALAEDVTYISAQLDKMADTPRKRQLEEQLISLTTAIDEATNASYERIQAALRLLQGRSDGVRARLMRHPTDVAGHDVP